MSEPALLESPATRGGRVPAGWRPLPAAAIPSPILAIAAEHDGRLWAGGVGGAACLGEGLPAPTPRMSVSALARIDDRLVAGGADGLAYTDGREWERAQSRHGGSPVAGIVTVAGGGEPALLAATLGDGIIRSTDSGRTWMPSGFGLEDLDVTALLAVPGPTVLAGTAGGIYRSSTAGRTWRRIRTTDASPVAALAAAAEFLLAALENGDILRSPDAGETWTHLGRAAGSPSALAVLPDGTVLASTATAGIQRSTDGGRSWDRTTGLGPCTVYCLATTATGTAYAGTGDGLVVSTDGGRCWEAMPVPPTHDLARILDLNGSPLLAGRMSGVVRLGPTGRWERLGGAPFPLTTAAVTPAGDLLASGPQGLLHHTGQAWREIVRGEPGHVRCLTFRGRSGWATPASAGDRLLRSQDGGRSWQAIDAPFGALSPAALHACSGLLLAAVADPRHDAVQLWSSADDGTHWRRDRRIGTMWPFVTGATVSNGTAIVLGLGNHLIIRDGTSARTGTVPEGLIRAVTGTPAGLSVLTTGSLWSSADPCLGRWQRESLDVDILDLCCVHGDPHLLLTGGRVLTRAAPELPYRQPVGEDHHD